MVDIIELDGIETHNLKKVDVVIPHRAITVISGVSGSGKSSLAFDTLYAEGQRRFVESLSTYARQFLKRMEKPPVARVKNILPAVALRQKNTIKNARSTVATLTEIADHLALVFAHVGSTTCPECGQTVRRDSVDSIVETLLAEAMGARVVFLADVHVESEAGAQQVLSRLAAGGHQRLWLDGEIVHLGDMEVEELLDAQSFAVVIDRMKVKSDGRMRLREAVEAALDLGDGRVRVLDLTREGPDGQLTFSVEFACNNCERSFIAPVAPLFSFNSPIGACPECSGFGKTAGIDREKVVPNPDLSLEKGAVAPYRVKSRQRHQATLLEKARKAGVPIDVPFGRLRPEDKAFVFEGRGRYKGIRGFFDRLKAKRHKPQARMLVARYRGYTQCPVCDGDRLSFDARCVTVGGLRISQFYEMRIEDALESLRALGLSALEAEKVAPLMDEILSRLEYLDNIGLGYLGLDRQSRTLSGGEVQRIQLTTALGRTLTDTLYVLDEPTAGLHPRDTLALLDVLRGLRGIGNAVVVVEHDLDIICGADWLVELGPQGGARGGELLYQGDLAGLREAESPTGEALRGRAPGTATLVGSRAFEPARDPYLTVVEARENNLQGLTVNIPLQRLTCVTGVSGSGKSSLVHRCIYDAYRRARGVSNVDAADVGELVGFDQVQDVVLMKQGGLGRSSRSTVGSYCKAWEPIRKIYGGLLEARRRGLGPGHFSFNRPGGRCEVCEGTGRLVVEMHFMADIEIVCESCQGRRFTNKLLEVCHRGRDINEVLNMTVREARAFFTDSRAVVRRLDSLVEVGLGYLRLGQTTSTLSGGEAQRLLLASHLSKRHDSGKAGALFIFDEPTVGLHAMDVSVLVGALRRTVSEGHTVLVVEHNIEFIAEADHIIDLGPEGGPGGGTLVAQGPPAEIAACAESLTGSYLHTRC